MSLLDNIEPMVNNSKVDPEIKSVYYSESWIPIGISTRGRDFICLDLDPSETGKLGQVIFVSVDFHDHSIIASNFKNFLSMYFVQAQTGKIEMDLD